MSSEIAKLQSQAVKSLNRGDLKSLHALSLKILQIDQQHADAWFFLSIIAAVQNQFRKAIEFVDRAVDLDPDQSEYLSQKAKYHSVIREDIDAKNAADKALKLKPVAALTLDTLGVVYTKLGDYRLARDLLAQAVSLSGKNPQYHFNLATAEQFLGHATAAKHHYQQAIALHPHFYRAYWSLSELEKGQLDGSRTPVLENLIKRPNLQVDDQLYLAHALAQEYEQQKAYKKAFATLAQAKEKKAQQLNYTSDQDAQLFDALLDAFSQRDEIIDEKTQDLGEGVIFIVGMPRSGTTLVERIVSNHSQVESLGELQNFGLALRNVCQTNSPALLDRAVIAEALKVAPDRIGRAYLDAVALRRQGAPYFIDKLPLNFLYIGFIRRCLPKAKVICLRRHPLDTCLSNYRQLFAINFSYYNYHYRLRDTAAYYQNFDKLIGFWRSLFGDALFELSYENLIDDPRGIIASLLDYLGLAWEESCLHFHTNDSAVATPSATQVRENFNTRAIGRWKHYAQQLEGVMGYFDAHKIPY